MKKFCQKKKKPHKKHTAAPKMGKGVVKGVLLDIVVRTGFSKEGHLSSNGEADTELAA